MDVITNNSCITATSSTPDIQQTTISVTLTTQNVCENGLSPGAIAGIAVGAAVGVALLVLLMVFVVLAVRRQRDTAVNKQIRMNHLQGS